MMKNLLDWQERVEQTSKAPVIVYLDELDAEL